MKIGPGLHANLVLIGICCAWIALIRLIIDTLLRILLIVCLALHGLRLFALVTHPDRPDRLDLHVHACVSTRRSGAVLLV